MKVFVIPATIVITKLNKNINLRAITYQNILIILVINVNINQLFSVISRYIENPNMKAFFIHAINANIKQNE